MKMSKGMSLGLVLAASLVGVSSASAANWDPQGVSVTATQVGAGTLTAGASVTCNTGDTNLTATGDLAVATGTTNPVAFGSCTNSILPSATTTVTTTGDWTFTATSTTSVDATAVSSSGFVAEINIGGICTVRVPSPVHIANNTWNNTTHRLTVNSSATFPVQVSSSILCPGVSSTGRLDATFQLPSNVIIT